MFYNSELMTNSVLRDAWLSGNHQRIESGADNILNICNEVSARLEYQTARHRLSLRASAVLLSGTASIYRQELDRLYSDCVELDRLMIRRRVCPGVSRDDPDVSQAGRMRNVDEVSAIDEQSNKSAVDISPTSDTTGTDNRSVTGSNYEYCADSHDCSNSSRGTRKNRGTQTSRSSIRRVGLDQGLPVGVITVYDGESRTPVGVICSNINPSIRRLYRNI